MIKNWMITIKISGIDDAKMKELRPKESKIMMSWALNGTLHSAYVKEDLTGAFLILRASSILEVTSLMKTLPMYPFMQLDIVPLEKSSFLMRFMLRLFLLVGSIIKLIKR